MGTHGIPDDLARIWYLAKTPVAGCDWDSAKCLRALDDIGEMAESVASELFGEKALANTAGSYALENLQKEYPAYAE